MNKFSKRLLSLLVAVVLVATMLPTVFAEDPVYTDWNGDAAALVDGAYLKLTADKNITEVYNVNGISVTIDLGGNKITSSVASRIFYVTDGGTLTVKNGTIEAPGCTEDRGGLLYVNSGSPANTLNLDGVTVNKIVDASGVSTCGILYARGPVNLKNSSLQIVGAEAIEAAAYAGGIIRISSGCTLTIDNSTVTGAKATSGGAIFAEGSGKVILNSGTITNGVAEKGHAIYTGNKNAVITINGGTVGHIWINKGKLYVNGGTVTSMWYVGKTECVLELADGITTTFNPVNNEVTGYEAYLMDKSTSQTKYTLYKDFDDAMAAAAAIATPATTTVSLMADVTADQVVVPAGVTLNLYGKTLTANAVSSAAAGAQIKDEKGGKNAGGKLVCGSVSLAEDNNFAPINNDGVWYFQKFAFASEMEGNVFKFYITDAADAVQLDEHWTNLAAGITAELEVS
ncbi:MAG: hypothetical protein IKA47_10225, partial [Oscillospiraceae bacterium]|nr:hypothetical protein [Oscillospiraceae bacterium]